MAEPMQGLTEGRNVHFVLPDGQHRAAVVAKVWDKVTGCATLTVFADQPNDTFWAKGEAVVCETSVLYSEDPKPGTWHWMERA